VVKLKDFFCQEDGDAGEDDGVSYVFLVWFGLV
jgi:hypothetical protein